MRKLMFLIALYFGAITLITAQSKQLKEGKITYAISTSDTTADDGTAGMMPKSQVIYFKDSLTRTEAAMMGNQVVVITDKASGEAIALMEMMGEKYALKMTEQDFSTITEMAGNKMPKNTKVKVTDEKKKIAGYKCTKAFITFEMDGKPFTNEVWFTNEIISVSTPLSNSLLGQGKTDDIKGFIMEFISTTPKGIVKMTCTGVDKTQVAADMFKVPEGYTVKNLTDLMGGMK